MDQPVVGLREIGIIFVVFVIAILVDNWRFHRTRRNRKDNDADHS